MYYIYIIQNTVNLKIYVGQTINPARRWRKHKSVSKLPKGHKSKQVISYAIAKYGIDNYTFTIIEEWATQEEADMAEEFWISYFNSQNKEFGYNRAPGGDTSWNTGTKGIVKPNAGSFTKGVIPWNKGQTNMYSDTSLELMTQSHQKGQLKNLTPNDILQIVELYKTGQYTQLEISKQFNVNMQSVSAICRGDHASYITNIDSPLSKVYSHSLVRGEQHGRSKLKEQDILKIVALYNDEHYTQEQLAKEFNITRAGVSAILTGRNWSHITGITHKNT